MPAKLMSAAGGGITLGAASTATDKTITVPADNGTMALTSQINGFRSRIINGLMTINQRVLTGPTSGYFVDRWQVGGVSATSLQTSGLPTGFAQAVSINRTVAGTAYISQNIESKNVTDLNGQVVTVSFYAKNVSGVGSITVNLAYANASDNFSGVTSIQTITASASPSSSWTYYMATFSALPSSVANGLQLNISAVIAASGTLEITGVQLEKGSVATGFDYRPYGTELALCQRYYYRIVSSGSNANILGTGLNDATTTAQIQFSFPVTMRTSPTSIEQSGTATNYALRHGGGATVCSSVPVFVDAGQYTATVLFTVASGLTTGGAALGRAATAGAYIGFPAEL